MTTLSSKLCLLLVGWLALLAAASPDAVRTSLLDDSVVNAQSGASARERWESMTPAQRARMEQRFEKLKKMEASERASLEKRAKRIRKVERRIVAGLSEADRERLMRQPPAKRSELLAELVEAELRHRGQRIEAKLPKEIREWLSTASPEERRARLAEFKSQTRERTSVAAVEQVAEALGFGEQEIARLKQLPIEERMNKVLELHKRLSKEQIEKVGLPKGLSAERWTELDKLPPREYFSEIMALRADGALGDSLRGPNPGERDAKELRESGRDLARQLKPDPKQRLELSELTPVERSSELDRRRRSRVMRVVRERELLNERQLDVLGAMSDDEFFRQSQRLSQEIRRGKKPRVDRAAKKGQTSEGRGKPRGAPEGDGERRSSERRERREDD